MISSGRLRCLVINISMKLTMTQKMELIKRCKKTVNLFKRKYFQKSIKTVKVDLKKPHSKSKFRP